MRYTPFQFVARFLAVSAAGWALMIAVLVAAVGCRAPAPATPDVSVPAQHAAVRMMLMDFDLDGEADSACTAWRLDGPVWITAKHCVDEPGDFTIDGGPVLVYRCSPAADVCALLVPLSAATGVLTPAADEPEFGDRVHYIGYPWHNGYLYHGVFEGLWSGCPDDVDGLCMFTGFTDGGASGSPLINEAGRVVGVVVASVRGRPYSFAVPLGPIRALLESF